MPTPSEPDIERMHRYFAVQCNNVAWEIAETKDPSEAQLQTLLLSASASAWHWSKIGKPIHHARASMLLGWANAVACRPADARQHTDQAAALVADEPEDVCAWDRAFLQLLEARTRQAEAVPGRYAQALDALDAARALLTDEGDRDVFDQFRTALPAALPA